MMLTLFVTLWPLNREDVKVWDIRDGAESARFPVGRGDPVDSVFSWDGRYLIVAAGQEVRILSSTSGAEQARFSSSAYVFRVSLGKPLADESEDVPRQRTFLKLKSGVFSTPHQIPGVGPFLEAIFPPWREFTGLGIPNGLPLTGCYFIISTDSS
jgi:hypothetical protein